MEKKEERPWCMITEMDQYLFGQGTHYEIYKKLGAHLTEYDWNRWESMRYLYLVWKKVVCINI